MARYITEDEVREILTMPQAIELVRDAFRDRANGEATDVPRQRTRQPGGHLHILQAAAPKLNVIGFKAYYPRPSARTFLVTMMNLEKGNLEGIIEADWLGAMRTGAASGVATDLLAREDASVLASFGAGHQAVTQIEAVCAVRSIREVRVLARDQAKLAAFCRRMSEKLAVEVRPADSAEDALKGAHIVNTITRAATPVFDGDLLEPGQHLNAAGINVLDRREIDLRSITRSAVVAVDSVPTAKLESGDLLPAFEAGLLHWENLAELGDILVGRRPGRASDRDITLFKSHGMGLQDLYAAKFVLDAAIELGLGVQMPG